MARLLIMAKVPIPGTDKTRLGLPAQDGARLQEALIKDTVSKARPLGPTTVAGAPPERLDPIRRLLPEDAALIPESGGDLGGRMQAAAAALFERSFEPVLILGTDSPTLPAARIEEAARALDAHDAVIVPSTDGGYVVLGLGSMHEVLFSGVAWSTESVHRQTLERAREAGI